MSSFLHICTQKCVLAAKAYQKHLVSPDPRSIGRCAGVTGQSRRLNHPYFSPLWSQKGGFQYQIQSIMLGSVFLDWTSPTATLVRLILMLGLALSHSVTCSSMKSRAPGWSFV